MWIKTLTLTATAVLLTLAWGYLGMLFGLIPENPSVPENPKETRMGNLILIEDDLIESLKSHKEKYKTFHCCVSKNEGLRCIPKTRKYKLKIKKMNCSYDGYDVELNKMHKLKRLNK